MKRYLAETIELGLFLLIYLFPVHSFAQETVEQVLQFEHTVMNIGTYQKTMIRQCIILNIIM